MTFHIKCPACEWRSHELDNSYWHMRYRLDLIKRYETHYTKEHSPIPLPECIRNNAS